MMNKLTSHLLVWILIATHTCGRKCQSIRDFSECSQEWVTNRESRERLQLNPSEWVIVLYIVIGTSIQASTFCQLAMATKTWKVPCMSEVWPLLQKAMSKSKKWLAIISMIIVNVFFFNMCKQDVELSALGAVVSINYVRFFCWRSGNSENDMFGVSNLSALVQHCWVQIFLGGYDLHYLLITSWS